jgi:hypothetical protein
MSFSDHATIVPQHESQTAEYLRAYLADASRWKRARPLPFDGPQGTVLDFTALHRFSGRADTGDQT